MRFIQSRCQPSFWFPRRIGLASPESVRFYMTDDFGNAFQIELATFDIFYAPGSVV